MKTITIYSNQNQPNTNNYIYGIYTGIKWQCVELARRYMIITKNLTFPAVENAYDLFKLPYFISIYTNTLVSIHKYKNGSIIPFTIGSLLIWSKYVDDTRTGHVAIITYFDSKHIHIIEQNMPYPKRILSYYIINNHYYINDVYLLGWITV